LSSNVRSNLERLLKEGHFVVTGEIGPPKNADSGVVIRKAEALRGYCDAASITDNQTAVVRMSSLVSSLHVINTGMEPIMQMTVRDRNRIAIQSDLLGAYSLGIRNVVCMSGDHQSIGNHPESIGVNDLDSIQLIKTVRDMGERACFVNGETIEGVVPDFFTGAVTSPFLEPFDLTLLRLEKKIYAGASFIQTQCIYDIQRFKTWLQRVKDMGLSEKAYFIPGLMPLKSHRVARYMQENIPGIEIPEAIIRRMERAADPAKEGVKLVVEQIQWLKSLSGISGVHIMAVGWEEIIPEIVCKAGLSPRPE
jgi:methylenetetrahydrofolate reductase (NADPH)